MTPVESGNGDDDGKAGGDLGGWAEWLMIASGRLACSLVHSTGASR